jgi:hypothetical protein
MGLLANNHLGERGLFAYLSSRHGLLKNYVPFVSSAEAAIPFNAICSDTTRIRQAARGQVGQFLNPEAVSRLMA